MTEGRGFFNIDHHSYSLKPGLLVFTTPGQVRQWDTEGIPSGYVLIFENEFLSSFLNDHFFVKSLKYFNTLTSSPSLLIDEAEYQFIQKLMEQIEMEIDTFKTTDKHILRALLYQVLTWLNRQYLAQHPFTHSGETNRHIKRFINLVDVEYSENSSVAHYADKLSITAAHLNDLCKRHIAINAKQFIMNRILGEAKRLLLYSDRSIGDIAMHLNFDDTSYFIRSFKKSTGYTPLSFRKLKKP